jgi:hypothetical protein
LNVSLIELYFLRVRDAGLSFVKAASLLPFYPPPSFLYSYFKPHVMESYPEAKESNFGWKIILFIGAEPLDSDGDGFSDIVEIHVRTFPGNPKSHEWIVDFDKDGKTDITVYRSNIEGGMSTLFGCCALRHGLGSNPSSLAIDSLL